MPSQKNIDQLKTLKEKISAAKSVVFSDYHGLTVAQIQELRSKVQESKGEFTVAKNTLIKLALKDQKLTLEDSILTGPTAILIATEDEISPIKALVEFAKTNQLPTVKAGILENRALTASEVQNLALLPGRLQLQAKLVGTLAAPLSGFINVLQGNLRGLVGVLDAIKKQKATEN